METNFLENLSKNQSITIEVIGNWIWISGNTKPIKEELKQNNFKWAIKKKMWYYHEGEYKRYSNREMSIEEIKQKYPCKLFKNVEAN